jgi:uncharacterized protein (DUF1015 family)
LTPEARRAVLAANPDSYLAVTRSIEDIDPSHPMTVDEILVACRASLHRLVESGAFGPEHKPAFFVYQLAVGGHVQTGLVGGVATSDFARGGVRVHEQIHHARSAHLARHLEVVEVQSSPIAVAHTPMPAIATILRSAMAAAPPLLEIETEPGFIQRVWMTGAEDVEPITTAFASQPLYLIDGHHRGAAAVDHRRLVGPGTADLTLCALFATDELANHAFHRLLPEMIGTRRTAATLIAHGARALDAAPSTGSVRPEEISMFDGATERWWALDAPPVDGVAHSLARLPPTRLAHQFDLAFGSLPADPVAGERWRDHIRYRPGVIPLPTLVTEAIERRDVLFVLEPIRLDALIAVADDGLTMPPKSTYFDPKVRSGIFLRRL